MICSNNLF